MKSKICIALSSIHLLALAICTYIASIEIESILVTGVICSISGIATGIAGILCRRSVLASAGFLTPAIALILFVLEAGFLHLGPGNAALPFCIVFIVNQVVATLTILVELNLFLARDGAVVKQITMRTIIVSMISFSIFFAIARYLLRKEHNLLMGLALGLLGLTFVGLTVVVYTAFTNRKSTRVEQQSMKDLVKDGNMRTEQLPS